MVICSIVRGVYEVRAQLREAQLREAQLRAADPESTDPPEDTTVVVPWWWWPWTPLLDDFQDPDLLRERALHMFLHYRSHWLLRQLIGSRNIMILRSSRHIMIHYAPPPLWIRFLLRITTMQKPRRWAQGGRGLLPSTVLDPTDHEAGKIPYSPAFVGGASRDLEMGGLAPPQIFNRTGPHFKRTPRFW